MTEKKHFVPWCPRCGSQDISEYINGMPDFTYYEKLEKQGFKFIYNGCVIDGTEQDFHCSACGSDYTWQEWHARRRKNRISDEVTIIDDSVNESAFTSDNPDMLATEADVDKILRALDKE